MQNDIDRITEFFKREYLQKLIEESGKYDKVGEQLADYYSRKKCSEFIQFTNSKADE